AEILGITQYLGRKPKNLSGGQRQRVAIGRAIVREPQVFLMDEPLSNLDAKLRNQMRAEIILLRKRLDTTFIYVTHDQTEAMTLGDRIVIMKDGVIQQVGTPQEVFDTPKNLFVAGFIGSPQMNFMKAKLIRKGDQYAVEVLGITVPLDADKCRKLAEKNIQTMDVKLGVRPEHTTICFDAAQNTITGSIAVNEMMGSELHLHVRTADDSLVILRLPTNDLTNEQRASLTSGKSISFTFTSKVMHLFDPNTEASLLF
ncbi:MAG: ATP-binding cassette domain-containing protein, partial [Clostridia bacterium]|nr:ATP-binding cassette domain-containing protein [Clostridia bacterium]